MKKYIFLFTLTLLFACSDDEGNLCQYQPTLTTLEVDEITEFTATLNGLVSVVSQNCDDPINTEQGFVYSTQIQPTVNDNQVNVNGVEISVTLENLQPNTTYYARVFLTNALGEFYGNEVSFTTSEQAVDVPQDAIAFYSFTNEASDITLNGYNGNSTNIDFSYPDRFENPNAAAWFNSGNSLITVDNFDYNFESEISISFWMKYEGFDDGPQNSIALLHRRNGNNIDFDISFSPDDNMAMHLGISTEIGPNVNNPNWKHYVIIFDGSTLNYYVDTELTHSFDASNNGIITNVDNVLEIGQYNDMGGSIGFQGALDDLGFWNRVLTQQEINILFSNQFD